MDHIDAYQTQNGMRPYSAPKHTSKRGGSAKPRSRKPRVQSGRVQQIKQFLSEQEAHNNIMAQQQHMMMNAQHN